MLCELCEAEEAYNEHHLIPRHCHRKNWWKRNFTKEQMQHTIMVCKTCHSTIHDLIPDEKQLGRDFNTVVKLKSHPSMANYLDWKCRRKRQVREKSIAITTSEDAENRKAVKLDT